MKPLTPREKEVVDLVLDERSRDHIARALGIALRTVDEHVENVTRKIPRDHLRPGGRLRSIRSYYGRTRTPDAARAP